MLFNRVNLILVILASILFYSCNKDIDEGSMSKSEMSSFRTIHYDLDYDDIKRKIQNCESVEITFKEYNILINDLTVADGISIQNSVLLNNDKNDYVLIDNNTERIYIRQSDYAEAVQTEVYFFKDTEDKDLLIKEYNFNKLNDIRTLSKFVEAENSYLIQKRIPKSEKEIMNSFDYSSIGCGMEHRNSSNITPPTLEDNIHPKVGMSMTSSWNIYLYKKSSSVDVSSSVVNFYTSWKSLNSSNFSSPYPYANINVVYDDFSYTNYISFAYPQLDNFKTALQLNNSSTSRSIHVFMTGNDRWEARGHAYGIGNISNTGNILRYAIASTINDQCLAHEIGHCIGAYHYNNITWDPSVGWGGWYGSDVMCTPLGTKAWYAPQYHKFYESNNRIAAKNVLDNY